MIDESSTGLEIYIVNLFTTPVLDPRHRGPMSLSWLVSARGIFRDKGAGKSGVERTLLR